MKHNKIYLSMAALVLVCAMTAGCSSDDNLAKIEITQPEIDNGNQTAVYTITVNLDEGNGTRAVDPSTGDKTFSQGDQIALIYKDNSTNQLAKLVSNALTDADIASGNKSATFSFNSAPIPVSDSKVRYIYPASMAATTLPTDVDSDNDGTVDYTALGTQDGTASSLANVDLGIYDGTASGTVLPTSFTLVNPLTIGAFTVKNSATGDDISSTVTNLTIDDGTNTYTVNRTAAEGPIYVAMKPITSIQTVTVKAITDNNKYIKSVTGNTLAKNTMYPINVSMTARYPLAVTATSVSSEDIGSVIGADGNIYLNAAAATAATPATTALAIITYVGAAGTADASSTGYKGLALALTDANSGYTAKWCSRDDATCLTTQYSSDCTNDMAGIANTDYLINNAPAGHTHDAAKAARNYNSGTHPAGTSAWFLPSAGQWDKMITAAGGFVNLKTNAGLQSNLYYSSTESNAMRAWYYNMGSWNGNVKFVANHVCACLAF